MLVRTLLLLLSLSAHAAASPDADTLIRTGNLSQAVPVAEAEAKNAPADMAAQEQWIDLMLGLGLGSHVQAYYDGLLKSDPRNPDLHYLLGRIYPAPPEATAAYETALRLDPDHARAFMGLAALHRAAGRLEPAAAAYQRAVVRDERLDEAWSGLLAVYIGNNDLEKARQTAAAAMRAVPHAAEPYLVLASLSPDEATKTLVVAVNNVPGDARVHATLAEHLLSLGEGEDAMASAANAIALNPTHQGARLAWMFGESLANGSLDAKGYAALVRTHDAEESDPSSARTSYDALVTKYPRSPLPWMARARLRSTGDPVGARADLAKAIELDPDNDEAKAALGLLLLQAGEHAEARTLLHEATARRMHDPKLLAALGQAALGAGDLPYAVATLGEAERLHPYDAAISVLRAKALTDAGQTREAYDGLRLAIRRIPDVRVVMALGVAAQQIGLCDEAVAIYDQLAAQSGNPALGAAAKHIRKTCTP